jgi:hypothetical protein
MPLTDLFIRKLKHSGKPSGDKYSDGRTLYLLVRESNKYWRMNYRYEGKHRTLAFGTYPEVSLAEARELCADARKLLRAGTDPNPKKKAATVPESEHNTFEALALEWLSKMAATRREVTQEKALSWLQHDVLPVIGAMSVATIKPRDILAVIQRVEARGAIDSAHRMRQMCGQILRYGVAIGWTERDVTPDLRGALVAIPRTNFAAITEPKQLALLLLSIDAYEGHIVAVSVLKLTPHAVCPPRRIARRRVVRIRSGRRRMAHPGRQDEDEDGAHGATGHTGGGDPARALSRDRPWQVRLPQPAHRTGLHEREHHQRSHARHGFLERRDDGARLPRDCAHDSR